MYVHTEIQALNQTFTREIKTECVLRDSPWDHTIVSPVDSVHIILINNEIIIQIAGVKLTSFVCQWN